MEAYVRYIMGFMYFFQVSNSCSHNRMQMPPWISRNPFSIVLMTTLLLIILTVVKCVMENGTIQKYTLKHKLVALFNTKTLYSLSLLGDVNNGVSTDCNMTDPDFLRLLEGICPLSRHREGHCPCPPPDLRE